MDGPEDKRFFRWKPAELRLDKKIIYRILGYGAAPWKVSQRVTRMVNKEIEKARPLVEARGMYNIQDCQAINHKGIDYFQDADRMAFGIVTIGKKLEKEVKKLFKKGESSRAVILDAVGSSAAESAADMLNQKITGWARGARLQTTRRFSPGYQGWQVEGQEMVFNSFKGEEKRLGVTLTPSRVMVPLKTLSFAVKLGRAPMEEANQEKCSNCRLRQDCLQGKGTPLCRVAPGQAGQGGSIVLNP